MHPDVDPQQTLQDHRLCLRPLSQADLEPLYTVAKDPDLWAGHPAKDRHKREVFEAYFQMLLSTRATLAITEAENGQVMGCSRYYAAPDHRHSISIGYTFLGRAWWGGPANRAVKTLMLEHAFRHVQEVWLHIDPSNIRSQRATAKLGAEHVYDADLKLGGKPGLWQCWRIDRKSWHAAPQASSP